MAADTNIYKYPTLTSWSVKAGTTLTGYKWDPVANKEVGPRKTVYFSRGSSASADADYVISGTQVPHGRFLHVYNGAFAGMIIVKAYVSVAGTPSSIGYNPPPPASKPPLAYPPRFQFGQAGAPCGGSSCCTDTCIQMIIEYWTDRLISLSSIRRASGETVACSGLNFAQALKALRHFGITWYQPSYGADSTYVINKLRAGYTPILVATHYGSYPNSTSGRCGNYNKAAYNGRTDCHFRGGHATLAIGTSNYVLMRDPDHNSPSRPEKPLYDKITASQLNATMKNLPKYTPWRTTGILYPTKKKT